MGRTGRVRGRRQRFSIAEEAANEALVLDKLTTWMQSEGHTFQVPLTITRFKVPDSSVSLRGVCTNLDLKGRSTLIQVKSSLIINRKLALHTFPTLEQTDTHTLLAIFLMHERKKPNSYWQPYLQSLPKDFNVPLIKSRMRLETLPCQFRRPLQRQRLKVLGCFQDLLRALPHLRLDFKDFLWAYLVVNTRGVYVAKMDGKMALVPFLDMFNHSCFASVESRLNEQQSFELSTLEDHTAGHQVFINYGPHDNIALLIDYGFVVQNNPHAVVPIDESEVLRLLRLEVRPQIPFEELRMNFSKGGQASWSLRLFVLYCLKERGLSAESSQSGNQQGLPSDCELHAPRVQDILHTLRTLKEGEMRAFRERVMNAGCRQRDIWLTLIDEQLNILQEMEHFNAST